MVYLNVNADWEWWNSACMKTGLCLLSSTINTLSEKLILGSRSQIKLISRGQTKVKAVTLESIKALNYALFLPSPESQILIVCCSCVAGFVFFFKVTILVLYKIFFNDHGFIPQSDYFSYCWCKENQQTPVTISNYPVPNINSLIKNTKKKNFPVPKTIWNSQS